MNYAEFLDAKAQFGSMSGFDPVWMPSEAFDFQQSLIDWALRKGRAAIFADCGLGKTLMQLVWAENVVRKTNRPVLILTPLAVSLQTHLEAEKFGIGTKRSRVGEHKGIVITNYEKLHYFDPTDFIGCVCDESSILKNFDGERRAQITDFMRKMPYRLLCTATAAPNDYIELGTSSEALGELGYTDMLTRFFKNDQNTVKPMRFQNKRESASIDQNEEAGDWRFKGHAEVPFWRWVCSWARAVRRPSDLGFNNDRFVLPPLIEKDHMIDFDKPADGMLFSLPAVGLAEQRAERRRTVVHRCEKAAGLINDHGVALAWCDLNDEGDLLTKLIPGSVQVSGKDEDEAKEEKFMGFIKGQIRVLVTKKRIAGWGLNMQHCNHMTTFPSHSFEGYYQAVRRCWRFGQTKPVTVDIVTSEGEKNVLKNLQRKAKAADKMFSDLVIHMNEARSVERGITYTQQMGVPSWLAR